MAASPGLLPCGGFPQTFKSIVEAFFNDPRGTIPLPHHDFHGGSAAMHARGPLVLKTKGGRDDPQRGDLKKNNPPLPERAVFPISTRCGSSRPPASSPVNNFTRGRCQPPVSRGAENHSPVSAFPSSGGLIRKITEPGIPPTPCPRSCRRRPRFQSRSGWRNRHHC